MTATLGATGRRLLLASNISSSELSAAAGGVLGCIGLAVGQPLLSLTGLVVSAAAAMRTRLRADVAYAGAVGVVVLWAIAMGQGAALLSVDLMDRSWQPYSWVIAATGTCVVAARIGQQSRVVAAAPVPVLLRVAFLPALVPLAVGVAQELNPRAAVAWGLAGTDLAQHVLGVQAVRDVGSLDYATDAYPRGLHMLAALLAPTDADGWAVRLAGDIRLVAALSWWAYALLMMVTTISVWQLGARLKLSSLQRASACIFSSTALLVLNSSIGAFVGMGAAASLLAAATLVALPAALLSTRERPELQVILAAGATCVVANMWQALVLVPGICLLAELGLRVRGLIFVARWRLVVAGACTAGLSALALPPLLAVLNAGGTQLAAIPGQLPGPPHRALAVGVLLSLLAVVAPRARAVRPLAVPVLALAAVVALLLRGAGNGFDLQQYYPLKVLWFAWFAVLPLISVLAVVAGARGRALLESAVKRCGRSQRVMRIAAYACMAAAFVSFALPPVAAVPAAPLEAVRPVWDVDAGRAGAGALQLASAYGDRYAPRVTVPIAVGESALLDRAGSYVVSKLISYRTGQAQNHGRPFFACDEVKAVAGDPARAVIITKLNPDVLRPLLLAQGCGDVLVVEVPGPLRDEQTIASLAASQRERSVGGYVGTQRVEAVVPVQVRGDR